MTSNFLYVSALTVLGATTIGSIAAPWKSRRLSPASIKRRIFWTGCALSVALLFIAGLPDWRSSIFMALVVSFAIAAIAFLRTSHINIDGRIYAAYAFFRRPVPPPAGVGQPRDE